jgi:hypothetical protein
VAHEEIGLKETKKMENKIYPISYFTEYFYCSLSKSELSLNHKQIFAELKIHSSSGRYLHIKKCPDGWLSSSTTTRITLRKFWYLCRQLCCREESDFMHLGGVQESLL